MDTQDTKPIERKQTRRFTSYEEFERAFYPESAKTESFEGERDENGDFGTNLAIESLNRHAAILKFGDS